MILAGALALLSTSSFAPGTIPVVIISAAEEKMAKRLASVVEKQLKKDSRFTRVEQVPPGMLTITLPSGVGWERRLDWTEIHYQARLTSVDGRTRVITGICWNWNLPACAKQILDAAAQLQSN